MNMDNTPRYVPKAVMTLKGKFNHIGVTAFPPGQHPNYCPVNFDLTAVCVETLAGVRWYGCQKAYIDSNLKMVVVGFPANFEEMAAWEVAE